MVREPKYFLNWPWFPSAAVNKVLDIKPSYAGRQAAFAMKIKTISGLIAAIVFSLLSAVCIVHAGDYLVVNRPEHADVIVVLAGDHNDRRYWYGLKLLREGYAHGMVVDATTDVMYGRTHAQYAADFVAQSAGEYRSQISICAVTNNSTVQESTNIRDCLAQQYPVPRSVLVVTSDFHTRRALSILRSRLPQYQWSVAAVFDTDLFGHPWWHQREWAKICFSEWERLIWWRCFESWQNSRTS
jgi:hypothetical protein